MMMMTIIRKNHKKYSSSEFIHFMNSAEDELFLFDCTHKSLLLRNGLVINSWLYALEDGVVGVFALLEI